ncbi:MAG: N-alpha-acetyl diaminobutyric acid deacetylase DoeB, partial [Alphaproteobacteria bacterium]|nr:N-alpha-acetyl diaminobutyric acid deacetylase DoeB [Alphaproteobacteria bacterium]
TPETIAIARKGARNLLIHAGILGGTAKISPSVNLTQPGSDCFYFSPAAGLCEHLVALGQNVQESDLLARLWSTENTGQPPLEIRARMHGLLIARHHPGLVQTGDCLAVLAVETSLS